MANKLLRTKEDLDPSIAAALDKYIAGVARRTGENWELKEIYETTPNIDQRNSLRNFSGYARALIVSESGQKRRLCWGGGFAGQRWFWNKSGKKEAA